ncbi:hypothetical protein [Limnoglobus roseus]|uniref:Uncharacterized protein n=1 Tax=Limnoglobus roseus TaxID=2598579 RepID=A0A5C1ACW8_9BACT|nr:hypothetical protein [Limnoglobus roseus]QEL17141.1 hypothetical protein PX52LOC_04122 [Limnoglobus roseus]
MPKEIDLSDLIKELNAAKPSAYHTTYMKLPVGVTKNLAKLGIDKGLNLSAAVRFCIEEYISAHNRGVCMHFDPSLLAHLELAREHLGMDRENLIALIVSEHAHEYLGKALSKLEQRKELEAKIKASSKPVK